MCMKIVFFSFPTPTPPTSCHIYEHKSAIGFSDDGSSLLMEQRGLVPLQRLKWASNVGSSVLQCLNGEAIRWGPGGTRHCRGWAGQWCRTRDVNGITVQRESFRWSGGGMEGLREELEEAFLLPSTSVSSCFPPTIPQDTTSLPRQAIILPSAIIYVANSSRLQT